MESLLTKQMAKNWIFIISILFFGCSQNKLPQDLIPIETFKQILIDIENHKLNIVSNQIENDTVSILDNILVEHGISDTIYQKTLLFYVKNPKDMLRVLKDVEAYVD